MAGHLQNGEETSDVFLEDVIKSRKAYQEAEEEFQKQLERLQRARAVLRTRVRSETERSA